MARRDSQRWTDNRLTLGEDQGVLLDEIVKGGLGQLLDVRALSGRGDGSKSCHEAAGDALVMHDGLSIGSGYPAKRKKTSRWISRQEDRWGRREKVVAGDVDGGGFVPEAGGPWWKAGGCSETAAAGQLNKCPLPTAES